MKRTSNATALISMLIILFIAVAMAPIALASAEIDLKVEAVDSLNSDMLRLSWTVQDP